MHELSAYVFVRNELGIWTEQAKLTAGDFKQDKLELDQIMAYAATPDTRLQLAVFKAVSQ